MRFQPTFRSIAFLVLCIVITSACQFSALPQPASTPPEATKELAPLPTSTEPPVSNPTSDPAPAAMPGPKGFIAFDREKGEFRGYAPDGSLLFTSPAPNVQYPSPYEISAVDGAVYILSGEPKQIFRSSASETKVLNINTQDMFAFSVSPDEKLITWSTLDQVNGASTLWLANRDGSEARQVAQYSAAQSPVFLFVPLGWTADGKILFDRTMTGRGGYILFGGNSSLYSYDPTTSQFATYVPAEEKHGICLDSYRLDLNKVVFNCGKQGQVIVIRDLVTQKETALPQLPDQGSTGSARFSPSGKWLAYAIAKNNPDNESGQVIVVPADLSAAPVSIAQVADNSFAYVQGWLDEDTLLFSRYANFGADGTFWTIKRDGSGLKQIATGTFIGWIP